MRLTCVSASVAVEVHVCVVIGTHILLTSNRRPPAAAQDGGGRGGRDERGEIRVRPDFKGTRSWWKEGDASPGRVKDRAYVIGLGARSPT